MGASGKEITLLRHLAALAVALLALAPPARALTMDPNPIEITAPLDVHGYYHLLEVVTGLPAGGVVLAGTLAPTDVSLVFQVVMAPGSFGANVGGFENLSSGLPFTAGGAIPDGPLSPLFSVILTPGGIGIGQPASEVFFVSVAAVEVGDVLNAFLGYSNAALGTAAAVFVPEPALAGLAALGLAALGARRAARAR
jgi:hypothetical protein